MSDFTGAYGLPSPEQMAGYRIWDSYFTPSHSHPAPRADGGSRLMDDIELSMRVMKIGRFEKMCFFPHVGLGTTGDSDFENAVRADPGLVMKPFERWPKVLLGMIQLNASEVRASLDGLDRWIQDGPMLGVYFSGGGPGALPCSHKNVEPLVERISELNGVIMQHTWFVTGGNPKPNMSTPTDLALLAAKFPEQKFLCAHAGGEWQQGIQAVRDSPNILVETSGFDPTAGFIEMAVRELGAERIVFGSHLPSRSLGTEVGKIIGADISDRARRLIFGENYRKLLEAGSETP